VYRLTSFAARRRENSKGKRMTLTRKMPDNYERKFADFIAMCAKAKADHADVVLVAYPGAIGDNYEEMMESLSRLAEAELTLSIGKPLPAK